MLSRLLLIEGHFFEGRANETVVFLVKTVPASLIRSLSIYWIGCIHDLY